MLSSPYVGRAELTESLADADEAVELARQAIDLAGRHHPLQLVLRITLISALLVRHNLRADPRDLAEARSMADLDAAIEVERLALAFELVEVLRSVLSAPGIDAHERSRIEQMLATALAKRFDQRRARRNADEAIELFDRNLKTTHLAAGVRVEAAVLAAELEQSVGAPGWTSRATGRLEGGQDQRPGIRADPGHATEDTAERSRPDSLAWFGTCPDHFQML